MGYFQLKIAVILLSTALVLVQGYSYFIKSMETTKKVCLTNFSEHAVAFIYQLDGTLANRIGREYQKPKREVKSLNQAGEHQNLRFFSCLMSDECPEWGKQDWKLANNLESNEFNDPFEMIHDNRWIDLPEVVTNGTHVFSPLLNLGQPRKVISMHISILASDSAQILLTKHKHWKNNDGYVIAIDGWDSHKTVIRNCKHVSDSGVPEGCDDTKSITGKELFFGGQRWIHVKIKFDIQKEPKIELFINNILVLARLDTGKFINNADLSDEVGIAFRSHKNIPAIFKLHKYDYLKFGSAGKLRSPPINLAKDQKICVKVIICAKSSSIFMLKNSDGKIVFNKTLKSDTWETKKLVTPVLTSGSYEIIIHNGPFDIGEINFCNPEEGSRHITIVEDDAVTSCQVIGQSENDFVQTKKQSYTKQETPIFYTERERKILCKSVGRENCKMVKACGSDGCFCISGFDYHENDDLTCKKVCSSGYYGISCLEKTGNCQNNYYNEHTGHCTVGCLSGYRQPLCKNSLLYFDTPPTVVLKKAYSVQIKFNNNTSLVSPAKINEMNVFWKKRVFQVQLRKDDGFWKEYPENFVLTNDNDIFELKNLHQNTIYQMKAFIVEDNGQIESYSLTVNFSTNRCTSLDNSNTIISVENRKLVVERKENDGQGCYLSKCRVKLVNKTTFYHVELEKKKTANLMLPEMKKFVEYFIYVFAEDNSFAHLNYTIDGTDFFGEYIVAISIASVSSIALLAVIAIFLFKKFVDKNSLASLFEASAHYYADAGNVAILLDAGDPEEQTSKFLGAINPIGITELNEYVEIGIKSGFLRKQHDLLSKGNSHTSSIGTNLLNINKNRYKNIAAFDLTRVVLQRPEDEASYFNDISNYINANYIDGYKKPRAYIATQGPMDSTLDDFWTMIWQEHVSLLVMMTNLIEDGKQKCDKYWPDYPKTFELATLSVTNENEALFADHVVRIFSLSDGLNNMKVVQLHYTAWPFNKVPTHALSVATFCKKIQKFQSEAPITIHCSAGVGRTGTIILIDTCLRMANAEGLVDPFHVLAAMREQRLNLVDNELQYEFVHLVLLEALTVPEYAVPDSDFLVELKKLKAKNKLKLGKQYAKLCEICNSDWEKVELTGDVAPPKNCRFNDIQSDPGCIIKIYGNDGKTLVPVNAVFLNGCTTSHQYIVTEAPLKHTIHQFWQLISQFQIKQVIVLNEPGPNEGDYLPNRGDDLQFDNLKVVLKCKKKLQSCKINTYKTYLDGQESKPVNIVRVSGWDVRANSGIPVNNLVQMWMETERSKSGDITLLVCHDGVTASGLFLATGFVLEKIKLERQVDVAQVVRTLRQVRPRFISGQEQYEIIHQAAAEFLLTRDSDSYDVIY